MWVKRLGISASEIITWKFLGLFEAWQFVNLNILVEREEEIVSVLPRVYRFWRGMDRGEPRRVAKNWTGSCQGKNARAGEARKMHRSAQWRALFPLKRAALALPRVSAFPKGNLQAWVLNSTVLNVNIKLQRYSLPCRREKNDCNTNTPFFMCSRVCTLSFKSLKRLLFLIKSVIIVYVYFVIRYILK